MTTNPIEHRITSQVESYISFKQGMGFQLLVEAAELRRLAAFACLLKHDGSLTVELALNWVTDKPGRSRWYQARRLETVHRFAQYVRLLDNETQIPRPGIFGHCHGRTVPYIFTVDEVVLLMESASKLYSPDGLRAHSVRTAIGLLWATGLRVGELCQLDRDDVELGSGEIHVRQTKFNKERKIPIHATVVEQLRAYALKRDAVCTNTKTSHFFLWTNGEPLTVRKLDYSFTVIRDHLLPPGQQIWQRRPPRLYDVRHSFACATIRRWYDEGIDVNHHLLLLSTYLGHVKPSDTYWYLTGIPELLALTTDRFQHWAMHSALKEAPHE